MLILEATRRVSRAAVARIQEAFVEYDRVVFRGVDLEGTYEIVREGRSYVLAVNDPTIAAIDEQEALFDCGD